MGVISILKVRYKLACVRCYWLLSLGVNLTFGINMDKQPTLKELIADCGGVRVVSDELGKARQSVWEWMTKGRLPFSEVKGSTQYSEVLAGMQRTGKLTPSQIRKIGLNI